MQVAPAMTPGGVVSLGWWVYLAGFVVTTAGAALGTWLTEVIKGKVTKDIWFAQEAWKEKYRLYTTLIGAVEEIAEALWSIFTDVRVLSAMPSQGHSTDVDGLLLFPEHQALLDRETLAINKIVSASIGAELMLNQQAQDALQRIKSARTRSAAALNVTYRQRIGWRQTAASEAKVLLVEAAREDLTV